MFEHSPLAVLASSLLLAGCIDALAEDAAGIESPAEIILTEEARERALGGRPVFFSNEAGGDTRPGIAFKIGSSQDCIWDVLNDLESYSSFVKTVKESVIYRQSGEQVCVRFKAKHWLAGSYSYHTCHRFDWPRKNWGSFALDNSKPNDFTAASGFWRTEALLPDGDQSLVYYVADVQASSGLAKLFRQQFSRQGLKTATQWLPEAIAKRQSPACGKPGR